MAYVLLWRALVESAEREPEHLLRPDALVSGDVEAPLALCSARGELRHATEAATRLLTRLRVVDRVPAPLPAALWELLESVPAAQLVEWHAEQPDAVLECARYPERDGYLLWMRALSEADGALEGSMHHQRRAATGRLMASVAHDVRSSVASIVYSADFLEARAISMQPNTLQETVRDICDASRRLQLTVDGLLDYARLGPAISVPVSLSEVLNRAHALLRSFYRDGEHRLRVESVSGADWVRGNPVVIEQIFANLLLTAAECTRAPSVVTVRADESGEGDRGLMQIQMSARRALPDAELPAAADALLALRAGARLSVMDARWAAESQGGRLLLDASPEGVRFTVHLPRSEGPR